MNCAFFEHRFHNLLFFSVRKNLRRNDAGKYNRHGGHRFHRA